jgi:hypothetical protein
MEDTLESVARSSK